MTRMVSLGTKIQQLHGLLGTTDLKEKETDFVKSVYAWSHEGKDTTKITPPMAEWAENLWEKHFA